MRLFPLRFRRSGPFWLGRAALSLLVAGTSPAPAQEIDVSGTWDISVEVGGGTGTPRVELEQQGETLRGTYQGRLGESPLQGAIRGSAIRFSVTLRFQDEPVEVTYSGTVRGESMEGTVQFGDRGTGRWSAKKRRS